MEFSGLSLEVITQLLLSIFLAILFLQSGIDKLVEWKENYGWLKEHFASSFLGRMVKPMLVTITALEIVAGITSGFGAIYLLVTGNNVFALYGVLFAAICLLLLFFGQRVAKDYAGASTLTIYFILTIVGLYIFSK